MHALHIPHVVVDKDSLLREVKHSCYRCNNKTATGIWHIVLSLQFLAQKPTCDDHHDLSFKAQKLLLTTRPFIEWSENV